jgi:phage tail sheath protein FI
MSTTAYQHGANAIRSQSVVSAVAEATTAPVIVGTAPVNLVRNFTNLINKPIRLADVGAKSIVGYSDDWESFTLSETISAHFSNPRGNVGPIYVINVLNPAVHRKEEQTTKSLTFVGGKAFIESDKIIIDTFTLTDKTEGTDYNLSYNFYTGKLAITSANPDQKLTGTIEAKYYEVDPSLVTADDIIGGKTAAGVYTGLGVVELIYPELNVITSYLAAPKWSSVPEVYEALCDKAQSINKHWYAMVFADIPVKQGNTAIDTIALAESWKSEHAFNSEYSKVFWPMAKTSSGEIYHLSSLALVEQLRNNEEHDGVPMESCSNNVIAVSAQYFGENSRNQGFDQADGNLLNSVGITTAVAWGGQIVLWGPHTAAFYSGEDGKAPEALDPIAIFDVNMLMQMHIMNHFQADHGREVDEPMTIGLRDSILEAEQQKLDALVAEGALIGTPTIVFLETENSVSDMINGNFTWNISDTPTPPAKHLVAKVAYTDAGFSAFFGNEEG